MIAEVVEAILARELGLVGAVASIVKFGVVPLNAVQERAQPSTSQAKTCHLYGLSGIFLISAFLVAAGVCQILDGQDDQFVPEEQALLGVVVAVM